MASAMRKMAVYLGLVEDDHRYQDKYDSYGEYEEYEESGLSEGPDEADPRASKETWGAGGWAGDTRCLSGVLSSQPISRVLQHCIRALTMKRVLLVSTSAKALR